jgi:hypothetical protein
MRPIPNVWGIRGDERNCLTLRSRSRPNVITITSSCDVNDKGNRRAKVMPRLSAGFRCGTRNLWAGSQGRCPYMGSRFFGQWARAPVGPRDGSSDRVPDQCLSSRHALMVAKSPCAGGAPVTVESPQLTMFWGVAMAHRCMASRCRYFTQAGIGGYLTLNGAGRAGGGIR